MDASYAGYTTGRSKRARVYKAIVYFTPYYPPMIEEIKKSISDRERKYRLRDKEKKERY
jgi:hypothetical protein